MVHDLAVGPHQGLGVERGLTCSHRPAASTPHSWLQITQAGLNHVQHKSGKHKDDCAGKTTTITNNEEMEPIIYFLLLLILKHLHSSPHLCLK